MAEDERWTSQTKLFGDPKDQDLPRSAVMILMWKAAFFDRSLAVWCDLGPQDEQFGLTFLAVLNDGPPSILSRDEVSKAL